MSKRTKMIATLAKWQKAADDPTVKQICDLLKEGKEITGDLMDFAVLHSTMVRRGMGITGVQYSLDPTQYGVEFNRISANAALPRQLRGQTGHPGHVPKINRSKEVRVISTAVIPSREERLAFYVSSAWRHLRYKAIVKSQGCCEACGRSRRDGIVLHVDHVKPISKYPHLKLVLSNLQVLCEDCNMGKGAWDETDWRDPFVAAEPSPDPRYGDLRLISNDGRSIA